MSIIDTFQKQCYAENYILLQNSTDIQSANQNILSWLLKIGIIAYTPLLALSFVTSTYTAMRIPYIIMLGTLLSTLLLHKKLSIFKKPALPLYANYGILMAVVTFTSAFVTSNSVSAMILLFLFQPPIVILDKSWKVNAFEIFFAVIYLSFILFFKDPSLVIDEVVNVGATTIIAIILGRHLRKTQLDNFDMKRQALVRENTDSLTGLYNRRKLFEQFAKSESLNCPQTIKGLLLIDIDNFKLFNDTYGHQAGDECLKKVSNCFKLISQSYDITFFRYGGEEFIGITSKYHSNTLHRLCRQINTMTADLTIPHKASDFPYVTVSIGATDTSNQEYPGYETLLAQADLALYEAKRSGKNKTTVYTAGSVSPI